MASFSFFSDLITPTGYDVPDAPTVDIDEELVSGAKANYASFQESQKLASDFNAFMRAEFAKAVPEFSGLQEQMAKNFSSKLRGEIPQDVADQVARRAAARGLGLGIAGSPAGDSIRLRDLGLTSFQIQSDAEAKLPSWLNTVGAIAGPKFDFANVFLSPAQRIAFQFQNEENKFNVQNLKNQMDAQPEPWMRALAGLGDTVVNTAVGAYTMGLGGSGPSSTPPTKSFTTDDYFQNQNMMNEFYGRS